MARHPARVWIDLTNSPHVLFFRPIIRRLLDAGVEPVVTARDFAQTLGLLELYGIRYTRIGQHGGRRITAKAARFAGRAAALAAFARRNRVTQAVSHGSPDMSLAARVLGMHTTVFTDYEGATAMHRINFRLSDKVMVPAVIPYESLVRLGITRAKYRPYPGIKEQVSLADFTPRPGVVDELGLDPARPLVILRPPATMSLYHRFENPLFNRVLDHLANGEAQIVLLPRTPEQARQLEGARGVVIPRTPVDGPSLVYAADLVISAGGTMNREAAILGTPVYTTFGGAMGAVDRMLIAEGRMRVLTDPAELRIEKRARTPVAVDSLADQVTREILRT